MKDIVVSSVHHDMTIKRRAESWKYRFQCNTNLLVSLSTPIRYYRSIAYLYSRKDKKTFDVSSKGRKIDFTDQNMIFVNSFGSFFDSVLTCFEFGILRAKYKSFIHKIIINNDKNINDNQYTYLCDSKIQSVNNNNDNNNNSNDHKLSKEGKEIQSLKSVRSNMNDNIIIIDQENEDVAPEEALMLLLSNIKKKEGNVQLGMSFSQLYNHFPSLLHSHSFKFNKLLNFTDRAKPHFNHASFKRAKFFLKGVLGCKCNLGVNDSVAWNGTHLLPTYTSRLFKGCVSNEWCDHVSQHHYGEWCFEFEEQKNENDLEVNDESNDEHCSHSCSENEQYHELTNEIQYSYNDVNNNNNNDIGDIIDDDSLQYDEELRYYEGMKLVAVSWHCFTDSCEIYKQVYALFSKYFNSPQSTLIIHTWKLSHPDFSVLKKTKEPELGAVNPNSVHDLSSYLQSLKTEKINNTHQIAIEEFNDHEKYVLEVYQDQTEQVFASSQERGFTFVVKYANVMKRNQSDPFGIYY